MTLTLALFSHVSLLPALTDWSGSGCHSVAQISSFMSTSTRPCPPSMWWFFWFRDLTSEKTLLALILVPSLVMNNLWTTVCLISFFPLIFHSLCGHLYPWKFGFLLVALFRPKPCWISLQLLSYLLIFQQFIEAVSSDVKCVTYSAFKSEIVKSFINWVNNSLDCYCVLSISNRERQSGHLFTQ